MNSVDKFQLPTVFIIFGVTGDLVKRKLLPAFYNLHFKNLLPKKFKVIGFSRRDYSDEDLRLYLKELIRKQRFKEPDRWDSFLSQFYYIRGEFDDGKAYEKLAHILGNVDGQWRLCSNKLFYLAVPPNYYRTIVNNLHDSGLTIPCSPEEGWTRVILEKPFGKDLKNALELDELLGTLFREEQIYRIDHFLGKETVRNILAFRFSNSFLAPAWNSKYIEKIEIRLFEKERVRERGEYYDGVGALRDVGQNHLLQLLALFTMTHPRDFQSKNIWRRRIEILSRLKILKEEEIPTFTIHGQYKGYKDEEGVSKSSQTETYFKIKTYIDNARWAGVPIYLESGKGMRQSKLEVVVTFKHQEPCLCPPGQHFKNVLHYHIQPQEKIVAHFLVKKPGHDNILQLQDFEFDYQKAYQRKEFIEAYEKLLLDMIKGDQTLFVTTEEILHEWRFVEPILAAWKKNQPKLITYLPGKQITTTIADDKRRVIKKEVAIIGLGKMGGNLAQQLLNKKWRVVGFNRSRQKTDTLVQFGLEPTYSLKELTKKIAPRRIIILSLPAGAAIETIIFGKDGLVNYLKKGDIVIDASNSFYKDSIRRNKKMQKAGIDYVDVGVSGGPQGALKGASLMIGGERNIFEYLMPLFHDIAVAGGVQFFKGVGAGHFVKMVHNGIEYGMMQSIAEGFTILKNAEYKLNLKDVAYVYNHGSVIESRLISWLEDALVLYGEDLNEISGVVSHTGEGRWTIETAKELGVKAKIIKEALQFRIASAKNPSYTGKIISALRGQFGGHEVRRKI